MSGVFIIAIFFISGIIVHYRGKRRHKFFRQIFDHSTFMGPVNLLMYLFSKVPNKPFIDLNHFKGLQKITENWEVIKEEALQMEHSALIKGSMKYDDIGFNSFFRRGWKRFYLKWYGDYHNSALESCPKTIELIEQTPGIKAAMFVVLPAGSRLPSHRDPFSGSLRYHLGLITPNSEDCFIDVDDEKYSWKDGEAVLFDETYIHHAENNTDKDRLIFFCDVKRPMKNFIGDWLNSFFSWFILAAAKSPNDEKDKTGNLNKAFKYLYQIRLVGKKLKEYNRTIYYGVKYLIFASIIYLVLF
ncbi:MAG: aspartyl/asparaginyl beta-hydroxylase domain-containing protein [Bacteroidota bacterium]